jgi:hypothetical protein
MSCRNCDRICSLWMKLPTNRLIAWDMNNCKTSILVRHRATIETMLQDQNNFKNTMLSNKHTIAPRCHRQWWRNNVLGSWSNVIQSDCFKILQEVLNGFPVMSWKQNHQDSELRKEAENVLCCRTVVIKCWLDNRKCGPCSHAMFSASKLPYHDSDI